MGRPSETEVPGERREELLAAGLRLFSDRPYDELGIDDIAAEAGVAKGLLYYYFGSKRGFYVAIVQAAARELGARLDPDHSLPPAERLRRAPGAHPVYVEGNSAGHRPLLARGGRPGPPEPPRPPAP